MKCYCCGGKVAWLSDEEIEEEDKLLSHLMCMNCEAKFTIERIINKDDRN